jgi:uncharacterized protein (TIGR02996 family)
VPRAPAPAPAIDPKTLDELDSLLRSDPRAAVRLLLHLWQTTFDPGIGQVLELVGAAVAEPLPELPTKRTERAARLISLAQTTGPEDRSAVLAGFEAFAREASPAVLRPAVEVWLEVAPDPRVARAALRILDAFHDETSGKVGRRLVGCLERHGDPSIPAEHAAFVARVTSSPAGWGFAPERLANVVKKLEKDRRCGAPVAPHILQSWLKRFTPSEDTNRSAVTEASLLEAIVASPDDDAPRLVYADWLSERRDPRGELIALQVARSKGKPSREAKKRETQLLADCGQALLGPLGPAVVRTELAWGRGFATKVRAKAPLPACPATRLLEEIEFAGFYAVADFETGARFDCVRRAVGPFHPKSCHAFPALAPRLVDWEATLESRSVREGQTAVQVLDQILKAARNLRLERFSVGASATDSPDVLARLFGHELLRRTPTLVLRSYGGMWTLTRSNDGLEILLEQRRTPTGPTHTSSFVQVLQVLPVGSVARLVLRTSEPSSVAEKLLAALKGTKVAAVCELGEKLA